MKIPTPVITLIVGLALAVSLLVSSMSAVSGQEGRARPGLRERGGERQGCRDGERRAADVAGLPRAAASLRGGVAVAASTSQGFVIPPHANYVGEVQGNLGSVAIVVHDTFAVAYFCNGKTQEAWFKGTPHNGNLSMTGKNNATLTANYALGHARGTVTVDGIAHVFSIIAVHKPSGLFQSIAVVRGATVKAGWIVLADGTPGRLASSRTRASRSRPRRRRRSSTSPP